MWGTRRWASQSRSSKRTDLNQEFATPRESSFSCGQPPNRLSLITEIGMQQIRGSRAIKSRAYVSHGFGPRNVFPGEEPREARLIQTDLACNRGLVFRKAPTNQCIHSPPK